MAQLRVQSERTVPAPAPVVYGYIADYRQHHPKFLPPAFSDFEVETGGVGAGTVFGYVLSAGRRRRRYRMAVSEPEPGRVLAERDQESSLVTTFTVTPVDDQCSVQISTAWEGAGGVGGIFERLFAPRVLRGLYEDELNRLAEYARQQAPRP